MKSLLAGYRFPYAWNEAHPARVGLLPRAGAGSAIVSVPVDPCYVFHPANAFETADGKVIVDVAAHDTMFAESTRGPDSPRDQKSPRLNSSHQCAPTIPSSAYTNQPSKTNSNNK